MMNKRRIEVKKIVYMYIYKTDDPNRFLFLLLHLFIDGPFAQHWLSMVCSNSNERSVFLMRSACSRACIFDLCISLYRQLCHTFKPCAHCCRSFHVFVFRLCSTTKARKIWIAQNFPWRTMMSIAQFSIRNCL